MLPEYRAADIFALACHIARDGDRDGLQCAGEAEPGAAVRCHHGLGNSGDLDGDQLARRPTLRKTLATLESCIKDPARRAALGEQEGCGSQRNLAFDNLDQLAKLVSRPKRNGKTGFAG
jgi:hypothetical protein